MICPLKYVGIESCVVLYVKLLHLIAVLIASGHHLLFTFCSMKIANAWQRDQSGRRSFLAKDDEMQR